MGLVLQPVAWEADSRLLVVIVLLLLLPAFPIAYALPYPGEFCDLIVGIPVLAILQFVWHYPIVLFVLWCVCKVKKGT